MSLENAVNHALTALRVVERAIHHTEDDWTLRWGDMASPATVTFTDDGVVLEAAFPNVCHLATPSRDVYVCAGEAMLSHVRVAEDFGDGPMTIRVRFRVKEPLRVA